MTRWSKPPEPPARQKIKLTNVARASLEELRMDYEDFLRQRSLPIWAWKDERRTNLIARRCATADQVAQWVRELHDNAPPKATFPEIAANAALALIAAACSLLDRQLLAQAKAFENEGGFTERLHRVRSELRGRKS